MSLLNFIFLSGKNEQLLIDGLSYPNDPGYQSTPTLMQQGLAGYQWSPIIWTVLDKTFISLSDNSNPNNYYITVFDHYRNKVSNPIDTGLLAETATDVHHIGSIINTSDSRLLITETSLHGPTGNWKHSRTGVSYDMTFPAWTDSTINQFTYHQLKLMSNGDIYNVGRVADFSNYYSYLDIYKSTNNGSSFTYLHRFLDWDTGPSGPDAYVSYPNMIYSNDDVIRLYVNRRRSNPANTPVDFQKVYYLESNDNGTTWQNVDNSYSKDVVTNGALSLAEMSNFEAISLTNTDSARVLHGEWIDSKPYLVGGSGTFNNSPIALYYWNGSSWVSNVITCAGHTIYAQNSQGNPYEWQNGCGLFKNGSAIDLICNENVSSLSQMSRFRTTDNGSTWTFIEQLTTSTSNSGHLNSQINKNIQSVNYKVAACCEQVGANNFLFIKLL